MYHPIRTLSLILFLALTILSCSNSELDEYLPGRTLPESGIKNEKISLVTDPNETNREFVSPAFQHSIDTDLENQMTAVEKLEIYHNKDTVPVMIDIIKNAQTYLYLNFLSFTCDKSTEEFISQLELKAKSIDVRLIVNKYYAYLSTGCLNRLENAGIKVLKTTTHSSYILNDQQELMIGSQSVVRMNFLSDGSNSLDRDMMLYAKGAVAIDAMKDFISIWLEDTNDLPKAVKDHLVSSLENALSKEGILTKRTVQYEQSPLCRFVAQRSKFGIKDIETLWLKMILGTKKEVIISGVKVATRDNQIGKQLRKKSMEGVSIKYLGNGYLSGNGELTMILDEWIKHLNESVFSFLTPLVTRISNWDRLKNAREHAQFYKELVQDSKIEVYTFFNFIHYKVWIFDYPAFFIGSINLDEEKFDSVYDAGLYCLSGNTYDSIKSSVIHDLSNSTTYDSEPK